MKISGRLSLTALAIGVACVSLACTSTTQHKQVAPTTSRATAAASSFSPAGVPSLAPMPSRSVSAQCGSFAANTPGGADPWGACWPGPSDTGVPVGTHLVNVGSGKINPPNSQLPTDNRGWKFSTTDGYIVVTQPMAVIDGVVEGGSIYVPSGKSLTLKNSQVGYINDQGISLVVQNSILNGGDQLTFPTIDGGSGITVENSNLSGGEHEILCYNRCIVRNSWLHDNANGAAAGAHQNGFLADGGVGFELRHNSVFCVGGCTADISFLSINSNAIVANNLLVASPDSSFCVYPGPDNPSQSGINNIVWKDNVFQRGANGKCATYGPVYGWYPADGTGNVWSGNMWASGTVVNRP